MNVEIGAEAALFPEQEYISGIFFALCIKMTHLHLIFFPKQAHPLTTNRTIDSSPCLEQLLEAKNEEALILLHPQLLQVSLRPVPVLRSKHNDSLT